MILHSKLFWIDMALVVAVLCLFFVKPGKWSEILTALIGAGFVISLWNHLRYFILYKKFY